MLCSGTGQLAGAPDGQDALLFVDDFPEGLGDLVILQFGEDLRPTHITTI